MSELKELINDKYAEQKFSGNGALQNLSNKGYEAFAKLGIPTVKNEERK